MKVEKGELIYYICEICKQRIWGGLTQENFGTKEAPDWHQWHTDCLVNSPDYTQLQQ